MTEKTCKICIHLDACSKWTDFPKQCGVPVCARFEEQSEWISVDERLPDREGTYLVCTYKGARKFGVYGHYFVCDEPKFEYDVTHWMPLPPAPKGEHNV